MTPRTLVFRSNRALRCTSVHASWISRSKKQSATTSCDQHVNEFLNEALNVHWVQTRISDSGLILTTAVAGGKPYSWTYYTAYSAQRWRWPSFEYRNPCAPRLGPNQFHRMHQNSDWIQGFPVGFPVNDSNGLFSQRTFVHSNGKLELIEWPILKQN